MTNLCPLCKSPNHCGLIESSGAANKCWCMQVKIPQNVLAKILPDQVNLACICKACALQFNSQSTSEL